MNLDVYCDESGPELLHSERPKARYMVIGSLWLPEVVIGISGPTTAKFITAYVADTPSTLAKIKTSPQWTP